MLDISKDAAHIYVGLAVFFLAVVVWKRGRVLAQCLIPVLVVAMAMEAFDLRDDWQAFGRFRWHASLHDLLNTLFWPLVIVLLAKLRLLK